MKHVLFFLASFVFLVSCSNEATEDSTKTELLSGEEKKWKLIKMTNSWTNSGTTGDNMDWQEYYVFKSNGTFSKSRTRNGATTEASGTFKYEQGKDANQTVFYSLTYSSSTELIASCTSRDLTEVLVLNSDKTLSGTWNQCDGPGLIYELTK